VRVGLALDSKRTAREGAVVRHGGAEVGAVTSGSFCPTLGHAAALALVDRAAAAPGTELEVVVRDQPLAARVVPLPFYKRPPALPRGPAVS
jgi:aminomethyltransferase